MQNLPFYRIFAADSRSPRDGKHIEILGHYDPIPGEPRTSFKLVQGTFLRCALHSLPETVYHRHVCAWAAGKDGNKHVGLNIARVQYWLSVGAQPTSTVARILGQAAIIPKPPPPQSRQLGPKKDRKAKK